MKFYESNLTLDLVCMLSLITKKSVTGLALVYKR